MIAGNLTATNLTASTAAVTSLPIDSSRRRHLQQHWQQGQYQQEGWWHGRRVQQLADSQLADTVDYSLSPPDMPVGAQTDN